MNSEDISLIASETFIQRFVYSIIQNMRARNFDYKEKHVVHADLVPRMSEKTMEASLKEKVVPKTEVSNNLPAQKKENTTRMSSPIIVPRAQFSRQNIHVPIAPRGVGLSQDYGKITPLLNDPSISTIECSGESRPIMIIRAGQKQGTRIILTAKEIRDILTKVSDSVHIPLLEGVFRAAVDNFSISAVISEIIGSRFIIKKQTAYALLER